MIGNGPGKLENKPREVARNTWSRFLLSVINAFVCKTDRIDICAFPYCKYSSVFARFENMDSSSNPQVEEMWQKKKKRDVFITGFTTWGVIQLSRSNYSNTMEIAVVLKWIHDIQISIFNYLSQQRRSWPLTLEISTRYRVSWKLRGFYFLAVFGWVFSIRKNQKLNELTCKWSLIVILLSYCVGTKESPEIARASLPSNFNFVG